MRIFLMLIFIAVNGLVMAQPHVEHLKTKEVFSLKDGIYVSIDDFKNNKPKSPEEITKIIDKIKMENPDIDKPQLQIWGYASGGSAYVSWVSGWEYLAPEKRKGYNFNRIMTIGSICQFSYYALEYQNKGLAQDTDPYLKELPKNTRRTSVKATQYIIDLNTNTIKLLNTRNIQEIIMKDELLAVEWSKYKGPHKEKKYFFLKKYNDSNPWNFNQKKLNNQSINN